MPDLICNLVWMPEYRGEAEVHAGGFDYVAEHGYGHELRNFDAIGNRLFGYVQAKNGTVDITKLGANPNDEYVDGVRVIFISTKPRHGPVVIGWYEQARVWRKKQPGILNIPTLPDIKIDYQLEGDASAAVLIPVDKRDFDVPNRRKGFPGQSAVYFPSTHSEIEPWMQRFEKYFSRWSAASRPTTSPNIRRRVTNVERNKLVELAAIDAVIAKFGPSYDDRQLDNCGWDLEFVRDGRTLCVEVKGVSGLKPCAEVSINEYKAIQRVIDGSFIEGDYRLAIVTDALGNPNIHLFQLCGNAGWQCEFTGIEISATEKIAAVFG